MSAEIERRGIKKNYCGCFQGHIHTIQIEIH